MWSYVAKRLLSGIPQIIVLLSLVAIMIHLVPGDPVDIILGDLATGEEKAALRARLGLDRSLIWQWWDYLGSVLHLDLKESLIYARPVAELIAERFLPTLELAFLAMLVALAFSLPLGLAGALRHGRFLDHAAMMLSLLGIAVPNFWLAPVLILFFSLYLGWLPVSERGEWNSYILPCLTLGAAMAAMLSRMTRNAVLAVLREDYVRTARAKGLSAQKVVLKHVLRNAALPIISVFGLQFGALLTGSVITEQIFDWPGLGTLMIDAIRQRDYPLVQGCVLCFALFYLLVNLLTDLAYAASDPRISLGK